MISDIPAGTGKSLTFFTVYILCMGHLFLGSVQEYSLKCMCWKGTGTMCCGQGRCVGKGQCVVVRDDVLVRDNVLWSGTMC